MYYHNNSLNVLCLNYTLSILNTVKNVRFQKLMRRQCVSVVYFFEGQFVRSFQSQQAVVQSERGFVYQQMHPLEYDHQIHWSNDL